MKYTFILTYYKGIQHSPNSRSWSSEIKNTMLGLSLFFRLLLCFLLLQVAFLSSCCLMASREYPWVSLSKSLSLLRCLGLWFLAPVRPISMATHKVNVNPIRFLAFLFNPVMLKVTIRHSQLVSWNMFNRMASDPYSWYSCTWKTKMATVSKNVTVHVPLVKSTVNTTYI